MTEQEVDKLVSSLEPINQTITDVNKTLQKLDNLSDSGRSVRYYLKRTEHPLVFGINPKFIIIYTITNQAEAMLSFRSLRMLQSVRGLNLNENNH